MKKMVSNRLQYIEAWSYIEAGTRSSLGGRLHLNIGSRKNFILNKKN